MRPPADDDLVPQDDAVIGRAFRWSLVAIVAAAGVMGAATWWLRAPAARPPIQEKIVGQVADLASPAAGAPILSFTDITADAGIDFVHVNGARGAKLLPETMGSGVVFFDYDSDGHQDLLLLNSTHWPDDAAAAGPSTRPTQALYRNDGNGHFIDVTAAAGLDIEMYGMGAAAADFDGDGDADLYLTALGPNRLLRNDSGRFNDITDQAGVAGTDAAWSTSAGFFDADNDGDLDLFVCNYVRWSPGIDQGINFSLNGHDRAYGPPTDYQGAHPYLFRNEGDGTFADVSGPAGVRVASPGTGEPVSKALAVTFADLDADGFLDILVANDTTQNLLLHNRGDGTFIELGAIAGIGFNGDGLATGAMGIDAGHYANDDSLAVAMGNFANEMTSFYVSWKDQPLRFSDEAPGHGIGSPSRLVLSFGLFFFDSDLDGRLDLLQTNGHIEDTIQSVQASQTYKQSAQLFWNAGPEARLIFVELPRATTGDLGHPMVGRGAAYADIDGDGDLDVVLTQTGGRPLLLRNDQDLGHHWLRLKLIGRGGAGGGPGTNRDAIGAEARLTAGGRTQVRSVMPTRSYLSQMELPITFGLGHTTSLTRLVIRWPGGALQTVDLTGASPDMTLEVVQGAAGKEPSARLTAEP